jgi:serine/threonine protein kinase
MNDELRLLFHELADISPDEREQALAERQIAPEVRAQLELLLNYDSPTAQSLTACIAGVAGDMLSAAGRNLGDCGPYRLVRLLGRGGMGAVYLGERNDGEIQQKVAVKLLSAEGDRPGWRERFLKERQLLASLNHPSIVHVMDAGHTDDSRPFLVMEYVEGTPIDVYAAQIPVRDRLILFLRVCEAVSHAHRHLVIHRDLKPSNILVQVSGLPKLLDFGIAKLLEETGHPTQTIDRLLTPAYASPEQIRGAIQTTATDIYSLGAILYKLLTGRSPHESESGTLQAIDIIAGKREIDAPSRINPNLPADLDYIARKALRSEPGGRYASVEAFAADIRAFLEFRPVEARSGNAWYRARKFLRRYWLPVAAAALIVASLSVGLHIANRERAIAQRRFSDVRQLANTLFDIDAQARELPGSTKTRQLIVDTALAYLRRLGNEVRGDPDLALEVGNAYMRVARVQGVPISPTLGQADLARENLGIAEGLIQSVLKAQPGNRTAMLRAAQIAHDQMILARFDSRYDDALESAGKSANWLEKFAARKGDESEGPAILNTYLNVADQFQSEHHFEEALRLCNRGIEIARLFNRSPSTGTLLWVEAKVFQERGDLDQALKAVQESTRLLDPGAARTTKGGQTSNFQLALVFEGRILGDNDSVNLGRSEEAVNVLDRAFRIADEFVHADANDHAYRGDLAMAGIPLAGILSRSEAARALEIYDHTLRHLAEAGGDVHLQRFEVNLLAGSTYPLRQVGRSDEARRRLEMAFERLQQLKFYPAEKIYPGSEAQQTIQALADYEAGRGNLPRALSVYQDLLEKIQPAKSGLAPGLNDAVHLSNIYSAAAALYRRAGKADVAGTLEARRRDLWRRWEIELPKNTFVQRQLKAASLP